MDSILLVLSSEKSKNIFEELLSKSRFSEKEIVYSADEAKRILFQKDFDFCIINTPLPDEFGTELAKNISSNSYTQVMLIVKNEIADEVSAKVEEFGIFVISKPIVRQVFWSALKLITAAHKKICGLQKDNIKLKKKIDDIRLVDRAKCVLIEYLMLTENEAHKYIEKQAMDMRITKKEVAESIIKTYES